MSAQLAKVHSHNVGIPRKWSEDQLRVAVTESVSVAQVIRKLGLAVAGGSYGTVVHHVAVLGLDISHFTGQAWVGTRTSSAAPNGKYTLETIFCEGSTFPTSKLLQVILREGYRERRCESCGNDAWLGLPIAIEVDHANGVRDDHRLDNLRLLCPNCHAQTPTWRGRANRKPPRPPKPPRVRIVRDPQAKIGYQQAWRNKRRDAWIAANGPCQHCSATDDLTVAHVDPAEAAMTASAVWGRSLTIRTAELAKCHVLCKGCLDKEMTMRRRARNFKHGTISMYNKHGCRCPECTARNTESKRRQRRTRQNKARFSSSSGRAAA